MVRLKVTVEVGPVKDYLDEVQASLRMPGRAMAAVALRMLKMQKQHFIEERDSTGKKWQRLAPSTIRHRRNKPGPFGMAKLRDTGRLWGSLTQAHTPTEAIVGTNVKYAAVHQFGFQRSGVRPIPVRESFRSRAGERVEIVRPARIRVNIPKREYLYLNDKERKTITDFLAEFFFGEGGPFGRSMLLGR